ncbi:MAG: flagellar brake protein [Desulfobacula sp.]|uniref:flagellar brake protein n=1 Tax=Desulfobacula sp. TaxID=2593537 RepID=UPI0025B8EAC5|nr:flagellar brake protein [Desulfobacula sp.]MCD4721220.1 flagellar brake protein [Desulfobacula sp.]
MMIKKTDNINRSQRLFIELGTDLFLESHTSGQSTSSRLIGMQVGKYLIVQMSDHQWVQNCISPGDSLQAKYILADDVFGFNTRIIKAIKDPDHLLFLEYPQKVKSCNVRSNKRVECFLPVKITIDTLILEGTITNISKNGCLCNMDNCPDIDSSSPPLVTLQLPYGQLETLSIQGEIQNMRLKDSKTFLGILFQDLNGFSQKVLTSLVPALNI